MCLIPSYTEIEKLNQVKKVLNLLTLPVDSEEAKKNLLYNVAFMNNMVVKGYMKERTDMDSLIYETKDKALNYIVRRMPGRCHLHSDKGYYVVYIYVSGRQYSFHTNSRHGLTFEIGKAVKWDEIRDGWSMSNAEYHEAIIRKNEALEAYNKKEREYEKNRNEIIKRLMLRGIKLARKENEENRRRYADFWQKVDAGLTAAQKRTKAYKEHNASRIVSLYGEQLGMTWRDTPSSFIYTLPKNLLDDRGYYKGYWLSGAIDDMFRSMNLHI